METRTNHIWVGIITLVLLAMLAGMIIWLARLQEGLQKEYDILFQQSVSGLSRGSEVNFAGVPVGQVSEIQLYEKDPDFVRVRISVREDVPILVGTAASIQGSFTGLSSITLDGARNGAPPIDCETTACPEGAPIIPPKNGGLSALLADAPMMLERVATLTERMTEILSDENQRELTGILKNTNRLSGEMADTAPELKASLRSLDQTLKDASKTLAAFERASNSADNLMNNEGPALASELKSTLKSAKEAANSLSALMEDTRPVTRDLASSTLPEAKATMEELRAASKALREITEKLNDQGAGALIGTPPLPEYKK